MKINNKNNIYEDIINLPHHISKTRPPMDISDRAAQFSPFAALTGYDTAIEETGRLTDSFIELDENKKVELNEKLQFVFEHLKEEITLTITYFRPDIRKSGGSYIKIVGVIKKIDEFEQCIILTDGTKIPMKYIYELEMKESEC